MGSPCDSASELFGCRHLQWPELWQCFLLLVQEFWFCSRFRTIGRPQSSVFGRRASSRARLTLLVETGIEEWFGNCLQLPRELSLAFATGLQFGYGYRRKNEVPLLTVREVGTTVRVREVLLLLPEPG